LQTKATPAPAARTTTQDEEQHTKPQDALDNKQLAHEQRKRVRSGMLSGGRYKTCKPFKGDVSEEE
jgi:hypothetical protein